jgi:hypothetical protein
VEVNRSGETVSIRQLDIFLMEMLRQIPLAANPEGDPAATERIFSRPEPVEGKFTEDWKAYVEPELRHLFRSAVETVEADLKRGEQAERAGGGMEWTIRFPAKHLDAWLSATNQARLILAARDAFTEKELAGEPPSLIANPRDISLLQIHIYGFLQECFLRAMD